jgi:hypothetical protein
MKFDSPLLFDWTQIADEIEENENKNLKIKKGPKLISPDYGNIAEPFIGRE